MFKETENFGPRTEIGFISKPNSINQLRFEIEKNGYKRLIYKHSCVNTIYFASFSGETTQSGYIRARNYIHKPPSDLYNLNDLDSTYFLEGKIRNGIKQRMIFRIDDIIKLMANPDKRTEIQTVIPVIFQLLKDAPSLYPVASTLWSREHYILENQDRITVDSNLKYYGFIPTQDNAHLMGIDNNPRIEWKSTQNFVVPSFLKKITIKQIGPGVHEKVIRQMYFNLLTKLKENGNR